MLHSNFVETQEEAILAVVLTWSEAAAASFDDTKELVGLVRLPFVPIDSPHMNKAVQRNLVDEDVLRVCRLFQTDGDYRETMMSCEAMYRPRQGDHVVLAAAESGISDSLNLHSASSIKVDFKGIKTAHMPSVGKNKVKEFVDQASLQNLKVDDIERLLAAMLRRENEMRLHPKIQAAYVLIGENEEEMLSFTTAMQAHVASEFNVDPVVDIGLIRSASTLFPETAKLAHYVRHNRCFEGSLAIGDEAPDVCLTLDRSGRATWHRSICHLQTSRHLGSIVHLTPIPRKCPSSVDLGEGIFPSCGACVCLHFRGPCFGRMAGGALRLHSTTKVYRGAHCGCTRDTCRARRGRRICPSRGSRSRKQIPCDIRLLAVSLVGTRWSWGVGDFPQSPSLEGQVMMFESLCRGSLLK